MRDNRPRSARRGTVWHDTQRSRDRRLRRKRIESPRQQRIRRKNSNIWGRNRANAG